MFWIELQVWMAKSPGEASCFWSIEKQGPCGLESWGGGWTFFSFLSLLFSGPYLMAVLVIKLYHRVTLAVKAPGISRRKPTSVHSRARGPCSGRAWGGTSAIFLSPLSHKCLVPMMILILGGGSWEKSQLSSQRTRERDLKAWGESQRGISGARVSLSVHQPP